MKRGKIYGDLEYLVVQVSRANENDDDPDYSADIFRKDQLVYAVGEWMSWGPNDIDTCEIYKRLLLSGLLFLKKINAKNMLTL